MDFAELKETKEKTDKAIVELEAKLNPLLAQAKMINAILWAAMDDIVAEESERKKSVDNSEQTP